MTTLTKRIARLERAQPIHDESQPVLIIVGRSDRHEAELVSVTGINLIRQPAERYEDFVARLEDHLIATRGRFFAPMVSIACYADDPE